MNDILKYNTQLVKFIILTSLIVLVVILGYKIWDKFLRHSIDLTMGFKEREQFNQITLDKQVALYDDYRNYINGRNELTSRCRLNKRMIPYVVSPKCFTDKYSQCMEEKKPTNIPSNSPSIRDQIINDAEVFDEHDLAKLNSIPSVSLETTPTSYAGGFNIASKTCHDQSYDMCLTDNFNFI
jgi:hypothetical protein